MNSLFSSKPIFQNDDLNIKSGDTINDILENLDKVIIVMVIELMGKLGDDLIE